MFKVIYNNDKKGYVHILDTADYSVDKVSYKEVEYMVKNLGILIQGVSIKNNRLTYTELERELPKAVDNLLFKIYRTEARERMSLLLGSLQAYCRCNLNTYVKLLIQFKSYDYLVSTIGTATEVTGELLAYHLSKFLEVNENEISFGDCDIIREEDGTFTVQQDYKYEVKDIKQIKLVYLKSDGIRLVLITRDGYKKVLNVPYTNRNCSILLHPEC